MDIQHFTQQKKVDGLTIEYDLYVPQNDDLSDYSEQNLEQNQNHFDAKVEKFIAEYSETAEEIERLTCQADGLDYALSVTSGLIAGVIDIVFVGEWNFENAKAVSNEKINRKILDFAKKHPDYNKFCQKKDGNRLETAIEFLEEKYPLPGDNAWKGAAANVSAKSHHLDDFSHHPTLIGLICSIITQFTGTATYINRYNKHIPIALGEGGKLQGKTAPTKVVSGFLNWCIDVIKNRNGHLYSDMGGSKATAGAGMGLPGTFMSFLKELSALPIFKDTDFAEKLYKAFANGIGDGKSQLSLGAFNSLFEGADSKFDMRTEGAIKHELKRQAVPVVINELIVRCFYFVRHLYVELKEKKDINSIAWKQVLPFKNRTIVRMLTISTGTMEVLDMADAAIRAASKSGGNAAGFASQFVLRINFVGIGRFAIAASTDVAMGIKKNRLEIAMASADVAATAVRLAKTTDTIIKTNDEINEKLGSLEEQSSALDKLIFQQNVKKEVTMNICEEIVRNFDNTSFTMEEAEEAAKEIFSVQEQDFEEIKNRPWYKKLLNCITFGSLDKKKIVKDIRSLSTLQNLFFVIYSKCYEQQSEVIERIIDEQKKSNNRLAHIYTKYIVGINSQAELERINSKEAKEILLLMLSKYRSLNSHIRELEKYRKNIVRRLGVTLPNNQFAPEQLEISKEYHDIYYRCIMEMCVLDEAFSENPSLPEPISEAIDYLELSPKKIKDIQRNVLREKNAFGVDYFLIKYDSQDEMEDIEKDIVFGEAEEPESESKPSQKPSGNIDEDAEEFDDSELTDEYITSILHIAAGETKTFLKKNIHLKAFINCEGKIEIKNSVLYYNENESADEITMSDGAELKITNSVVICKGFDKKPFITLGSDSVVYIAKTIFIDCSNFIKSSNCKKFTLTKCELNNCFVGFADVLTNKPDDCVVSYNQIVQEELNSFYTTDLTNREYEYRHGCLFDLSDAQFYENSITEHKAFLAPFGENERNSISFKYLSSKNAIISNCTFSGTSGIVSAVEFLENKFIDCTSCINVLGNCWGDFEPCVKDCVFERCTDIIEVCEDNTIISYCQFVSCFGNLIYPSWWYNNNYNVEFCQFVNIENNATSYSDACIIFVRGKSKNTQSSHMKKCIFDTINLGDTFLIASDSIGYYEKPYGTVAYIEDCSFANCNTKHASGQIIKPNLIYKTLLKKEQSFKSINVSNCQGLDKVNKENIQSDVPEVKTVSSLGNLIGAATGIAATLVGGPVAGIISGVGVAKKLTKTKSQQTD